MRAIPPSDEASIRELLKGPAEQKIKNSTDRERALTQAAARMMREIKKARSNPADFIEFAFRTPKLERIHLAPFHRFWLDRFQHANRVQIEASKNHGKCCIGSERITLADGTQIPIEELCQRLQPPEVLTYDPALDTFKHATAGITDNGFADVIEIQLSTGRVLTRTCNEPLLTPTGFKSIAELEIGDYVACLKVLPEPLISASVAKAEARFLGAMLACGTCSSCYHYSKQDANVLDACKQAANALGFQLARVSADKYDYYIKGERGTVVSWLRKHALEHCTAGTKRVPTHAFTWSNAIISELIVAYWDGDGSYSLAAGQIHFDSKSKNLLEDVQTLLLRFGIVGTISKKRGTYKGAPYLSWRLSLTGMQAFKFHTELLVPYSARHEVHTFTFKKLKYPRDATCKIPIQHLLLLSKEDPKLAKLLHKNKLDLSTTVSSNRHIKLVNVLHHANYKDLASQIAALSSPNIWWSKITAKSAKYTTQTYSICVPENPVYIGEISISHNTTNVIGYLAWEIGTNPKIRSKLFTQSAAKARQRLQVISTVIQHNKYFHLVFPDCKRDRNGPWHKTGIQIVRDNKDEKEPTLEAMGIMGSVEGGRADLVLFDDISDYRSSLLYPQIRESLKNKVFAEILPMLDVGGRAISIATPHHQLDIIAALRKNKQWESYLFPVGKGDDLFHPLWPEVITREVLKAKCEEVGLTEYNRAYRLMEIQLGQQLIKPHHIKYYTAQDLGNPYEHICVQAYDLAATLNRGSSFFAGATFLFDKRRDLTFVVDAWRDKIELNDQANAVIRDYVKWDSSLVLLEETGYQSALRKYILERLDLMDGTHPAQGLRHVIRGISPGSKSKELRLMETLSLFDAGRILFNPRLDPDVGFELSMRGDLVSQLLNFASGKDADMADAFAHGIKGVHSFRRAADEDEDDEHEWDSGEGMETRLLLV